MTRWGKSRNPPNPMTVEPNQAWKYPPPTPHQPKNKKHLPRKQHILEAHVHRSSRWQASKARRFTQGILKVMTSLNAFYGYF